MKDKERILKAAREKKKKEAFPDGSDSEESACNEGVPGSVLGLGRFPEEGNGYPLQYSCVENPMDIGAWRATESRMTERLTLNK